MVIFVSTQTSRNYTYNPHSSGAMTTFTHKLNNTLRVWECLLMMLLALDLIVTLYGLDVKAAEAVLPNAESTVVVVVSELLLFAQLLQIVLPVYPESTFDVFGTTQKIRTTACKWMGSMSAHDGGAAEFASSIPKLSDDQLRTFGFLLLPVAAAVVWKIRRLSRHLHEHQMREPGAWDV
ncbi:hypothetical protein C8034_v008888 [Colletotrichum sidae]|uniref:Uncharacterized protein n=1 Tax=Colletotrichum sidae TaxID=1347389 RepID=A0A4R8T298_9PEZI|nr:hypothetical protein C8034_v008888 [Colletotrichum sidae]